MRMQEHVPVVCPHACMVLASAFGEKKSCGCVHCLILYFLVEFAWIWVFLVKACMQPIELDLGHSFGFDILSSCIWFIVSVYY
jgi:hypothetical protein